MLLPHLVLAEENTGGRGNRGVCVTELWLVRDLLVRDFSGFISYLLPSRSELLPNLTKEEDEQEPLQGMNSSSAGAHTAGPSGKPDAECENSSPGNPCFFHSTSWLVHFLDLHCFPLLR